MRWTMNAWACCPAASFEIEPYRPGVGLADEARRQRLERHLAAELFGRLTRFTGVRRDDRLSGRQAIARKQRGHRRRGHPAATLALSERGRDHGRGSARIEVG
jgi:hypothetical protein